jgi:glycine dehydrogenase subunit 1
MGRQGMRDVAELCLQKSHYAIDELTGRAGVKRAFSAPFFKEFALKLDKGVALVNKRLLKQKIIGGLDLGEYYPELKNHVLIAVTEKRTKEEIDALAGCF